MKAKMVEVQDIQELLSDDLELLLREIDEFCAASARGTVQGIPESVENYLLYVAKTGNTIFPWQNIKPLFRFKLQSAIAQFQGEPSSIEPFVFERFDIFRSAPFTIQRFSELITSPDRHYKIKDKFVSALEKTIFVVSTIEPKSPNDHENMTNGSEENNTSSSEDGLLSRENSSMSFEQMVQAHRNEYRAGYRAESLSEASSSIPSTSEIEREVKPELTNFVSASGDYDNSSTLASSGSSGDYPTDTIGPMPLENHDSFKNDLEVEAENMEDIKPQLPQEYTSSEYSEEQNSAPPTTSAEYPEELTYQQQLNNSDNIKNDSTPSGAESMEIKSEECAPSSEKYDNTASVVSDDYPSDTTSGFTPDPSIETSKIKIESETTETKPEPEESTTTISGEFEDLGSSTSGDEHPSVTDDSAGSTSNVTLDKTDTNDSEVNNSI